MAIHCRVRESRSGHFSSSIGLYRTHPAEFPFVCIERTESSMAGSCPDTRSLPTPTGAGHLKNETKKISVLHKGAEGAEEADEGASRCEQGCVNDFGYSG